MCGKLGIHLFSVYVRGTSRNVRNNRGGAKAGSRLQMRGHPVYRKGNVVPLTGEYLNGETFGLRCRPGLDQRNVDRILRRLALSEVTGH